MVLSARGGPPRRCPLAEAQTQVILPSAMGRRGGRAGVKRAAGQENGATRPGKMVRSERARRAPSKLMTSFSWLHISDLHQTVRSLGWRESSTRDAVVGDLAD